MVQLEIGTKRKVTKIVKDCKINMNGMITKVELNILPLGSYNILIGMDWLESHKAIIICLGKTYTYVDDDWGNSRGQENTHIQGWESHELEEVTWSWEWWTRIERISRFMFQAWRRCYHSTLHWLSSIVQEDVSNVSYNFKPNCQACEVLWLEYPLFFSF